MNIQLRELTHDVTEHGKEMNDLQVQVSRDKRSITQLFGENRATGYDLEALKEQMHEIPVQLRALMERVQAHGVQLGTMSAWWSRS